MNVVIRGALASDLPGVLALYAQPDIDDGVVLPPGRAEALFHRIDSYPDYHIHIALKNDEIVGSFALLIMDNLGHSGSPSGVVEDVAVDPAWQGKGIGKAMMKHAMDVCVKAGCYKMTLSANVRREAAHRFYESLGFEKHGYSFLLDLQTLSAKRVERETH